MDRYIGLVLYRYNGHLELCRVECHQCKDDVSDVFDSVVSKHLLK